MTSLPPPFVTDPSVCHMHTRACVHTRTPLVGCGVCRLPLSRRAGPPACTPSLWETRVPPAPCHPGAPPPPATPRRWPHTPGARVLGVPPWWLWESWGWLLGAPTGWGMKLPSPSRAPGATGPHQAGSHQPWRLLLPLQGFSPRYSCSWFLHTSFQAGSFFFRNTVVISWCCLIWLMASIPLSWDYLGQNIPLTALGTLFALTSLSLQALSSRPFA